MHATVEAALARYPLDSIPLLDRPYVTLAFVYASAGRPQQAGALPTRYEREVDPTFRHIDGPRRQWTWGQVALAEGRYADAVIEFRAYGRLRETAWPAVRPLWRRPTTAWVTPIPPLRCTSDT